MDTKQIEALRNRFGGSGSFPATYDDLTDLCDAVLAVLAPAASEPAPHIPLRTDASLGPGEILIGSAADAVRIVNVAEPAREAFPSGRGWRCEACGEMAEDVPDTAWRWAWDRYQHSHGQAGHFDAWLFGEPAREAEPTITTYCAGCIDLRARLAAAERERDDLVRQINEACAATECCSTLAEMRDTVIEGSHRLVKLERERDEARAELAENGTTLCCAYCGWIVTGITDPEQRLAAVVEHFLDCPKAPYAKMAFALQMGAICDEHIGVHQPACPICAARDRTRELTESLIQAADWQKRAEAAERERDEASAGWADDRRKLLASDRRVEELTAALSVISHLIPCKEPCPPLTRCLTCGHERGGPCAGCIARAALAAALAKGEESNG